MKIFTYPSHIPQLMVYTGENFESVWKIGKNNIKNTCYGRMTEKRENLRLYNIMAKETIIVSRRKKGLRKIGFGGENTTEKNGYNEVVYYQKLYVYYSELCFILF